MKNCIARILPQGGNQRPIGRCCLRHWCTGYQCGIYSSRKLEEACRYRVDFMRLPGDKRAPDRTTLARFRTGRCRECVEDLFYQFVRRLEEAVGDVRGRFGHFCIQRGLMLTGPQLSALNPVDDHIIHPIGFLM